MADNSLAKKLLIRPGQQVALLNSPADFAARIEPLPAGAVLGGEGGGSADVALVFVRDQADLRQLGPKAIEIVRREGVLWLCYPKGTSKMKTDLGRDVGWDVLTDSGWIGVSIAAIDDTWSAFRFRPAELIGRRRDAPST